MMMRYDALLCLNKNGFHSIAGGLSHTKTYIFRRWQTLATVSLCEWLFYEIRYQQVFNASGGIKV